MDEHRKVQMKTVWGNGCQCKYCNIFIGKDKRMASRIVRSKMKRQIDELINEEFFCNEDNN